MTMAQQPGSTTSRAPRRDAQLRREALLNAAAVCFEREGYGVPLELVAERAGVGRGTLYRNFKDRGALALAIFAREIDRLEATIDPARPITETIAAMVRDGARASALFGRIGAELRRDGTNIDAFRALAIRLERLLEPAVAQAHGRGELDPAFTAHEIVLAMRMAGGLLRPFMSEQEVRANISAALRLLSEGLRPREPARSSPAPMPC